MSNETDKESNTPVASPDERSDEERKKEKDVIKRQYLSVLRELRSEVQDLRDLHVRIKEGRSSTKDNAEYKKTYSDIQKLIKELNGINQERRSDTCRRIFNLWEKMQVNSLLKHPEQDRESQVLLRDLAILAEDESRGPGHTFDIRIPGGQYTDFLFLHIPRKRRVLC